MQSLLIWKKAKRIQTTNPKETAEFKVRGMGRRSKAPCATLLSRYRDTEMLSQWFLVFYCSSD